MPACLNALGDDGIDARRGGRFRFLNRTDLDEHTNPLLVRGLDVRRWITPEQHDGCHAVRRRGRDLLPQLLSIFSG